MKLWIPAIALVLAACTKPAPTPPVDNTGGDETPVAAGACQADSDCVVSCAQPENCCDQLCPPCEQVFLRTELEAHEAWRNASCAATSCPVAKCMAPTEETFARCESGACVLDRRPIAAP